MTKKIKDVSKTKKEKTKVKDYMTTDVVIVKPEDTVKEIVEMIHKTGHDGFPVVERGEVKGYICAKHLLLKDKTEPAYKIMSEDVTLSYKEMDLEDAARLMFREGVSKLPVVRETGRMIGIISNTDVIRSQIERADSDKIYNLKKTLEDIHGLNVKVEKGYVEVDQLIPTQRMIHNDELKGRMYEMRKGLAEPIIVVEKPRKTILVDGHHRAVASKKLGIKEIEAHKLKINTDKKIGLEKIPESSGIKTLDQIDIIDFPPHPLVKLTKMYGDKKP
ncbi:Chromosome segregation protein Spo0J containing CBS and ParB-like nuclease domain [Methanonatronarchaeum thermophilum]|uniref:Chromosome segregation protein Spo0J containing CBS and ParB-like nuclease domain n=1 Tax=Methanonatronarchaeum thermophilum TaxID=1927129 RepID=A0A1Y3GET9_9EURY|nr:CBS domain-containing protein [Methanonatronarchaeum thermophilum]OUJ18704.1 Chromosome segregation protein Spo0J containing CBS and ParB-like nuclease domain [Methanonatronarchaeum thermophilum]